MLPGSRADLGRVGIGVAIREGASAPDLSTPEAFKQSLIDARSVAYTDPREGGTPASTSLGVADRFGIADSSPRRRCSPVAATRRSRRSRSGEAEIAVTLISEIVAIKGARLAAPLPEALQLYTVYAAAIPASSTDPAAARAFIAALAGPAMAERWKAAGFEPPK